MSQGNKIVIANWKNYTIKKQEIFSLLHSIAKLNLTQTQKVVICPSFLDICKALEFFHKHSVEGIEIGAQDISHLENDVVCTNDTKASCLKEIGCTYTLIGHSERRIHYAETDAVIRKKTAIALHNKLTPIVCIGETIEARSENRTAAFLQNQLSNSIPTQLDFSDVIVAYEPVWAIGTGKTPSIEEISKAVLAIRSVPGFKNTQVIYGGSVNEKNAASLGAISMNIELSGILVGSASINAAKFSAICQSFFNTAY